MNSSHLTPGDDPEQQIAQAMLADRHRLRRWLGTLRRQGGGHLGASDLGQRFQQLLASSCARYAERVSRRPTCHDDPQLPISAYRAQIAQAILQHPVVIVCGETGSGKSTQIPQICLEIGRGLAGFIGHTQPRRLAARSIAARIAAELQSTVGQHVGYKVRFQESVSPHTYIKLLTDGMLLAETERDRFLEQYDTLIIDEAHERSLNIDFLLGYLHQLLQKRRDLRLIITSATLDAQRFAEHFAGPAGPAPIMEIAGRGYPVETRYRPLAIDPWEVTGADLEVNDELHAALANALAELFREGAGDVLAFLPTERSIREATRYLRGWLVQQRIAADVLPLYARLSHAEQQRIFHPNQTRRVILATNVAESSLTVPGIRYVIDAGTARFARYSPRVQVQRLPIERVAQSAAHQRQGRCGREAPGICIRLYSEEDFAARDRFGTPEIRRTNLAAVVLRILAQRWGPVDQFPFLDPPRPESIRDGYRTLQELEAVDSQGNLTEIGQAMSRLPVDPRIARIILAGQEFQCLADILILAAALEVQDPRMRPPQREMLADEQHAPFQHDKSDFIGYLVLWDHIHELKQTLSRSQFKKVVTQKFLSYARILEWQEIHVQLKQIVGERGWQVGQRRGFNDESYEAIHRALATGLLAFVGARRQRSEYEMAGGGIGYLWPGSGPFTQRPSWVMAAELVETSRRYLRGIAQVDPTWIETAAAHLIEHEYSDPTWSRKLGTVTAMERVRLRGLSLGARRVANYGEIDPGTARHLFIQHALVEGSFRGNFAFFDKNRALVQSLASLAARCRNAHLLVPSAIQYAFYDERLPEDVYDTQTLHRWLKRHREAATELLMQREDLLPAEHQTNHSVASYPSHVQAGTHRLQVTYRFDPERDDDGMSMTVDTTTLAQLDDPLLEWLVPGLLPEKLTALIRSLPKPLRRGLIPAPDVAQRAAQQLDFGQGPFLPTVAALLTQWGGEPIRTSDFDLNQIPRHLSFHLRVVDETGKLLAQGRSAADLRKRLSIEAHVAPHFADPTLWHQDHLTTWNFADLPSEVQIRQPGGQSSGFPALIEQGEMVGLRLFHQKSQALASHQRGVRRLCWIAARKQLRTQIAWLPELERWETLYRELMSVPHAPNRSRAGSTLPNPLPPRSNSLSQDLELLLTQLAFLRGQPIPFKQVDFDALRDAGMPRIAEAVQDIATLLPEILLAAHKARSAIDSLPERWSDAREEAEQHLRQLLTADFLLDTPWVWLGHFPRFLRAMVVRCERLRSGAGLRDAEFRQLWWPWWQQYTIRQQEHQQRGVHDVELIQFRWMLEEYRVSLFAQELGTSEKVSPQRLEKIWSRVSY